MRELLRRHRIFFLAVTAAALALRLAFYLKLSFVEGDSLVYGDIARNWLEHHMFARTDDGVPVPTMIRLPGYPAFLALVWMFSGVEHYHAVLLVQLAIDVLTCFAVAALALELVGDRAARWAFALAAFCPFLANYAATPLSETLAIFFAALTFYCAARACRGEDALGWWAGCGASIAASTLLRPDGGILLAAFGVYFAARLLRGANKPRIFAAGALVAVVALAPLAPWTVRNESVFHVFQPLAPRYANDPEEFVMYGYIRWLKTWIADYISVEDIYWPVPGDPVDPGKLPPRAFDSPAQRARTLALFDQYNQSRKMSPQLDAQFGALADERVRAHPLRYYVTLPALRIADMWLRPRTESLPIESRWWEYENDPHDARIGIALGALNLAYVLTGFAGALTRRFRLAGLMLLWVGLRSAFLGTLENPETRYTLECFPVLFVFAGAWLAGRPPQA